MLELGVLATINSDNPAYFGGYIGANFAAVRATGLSDVQLVQLAKNSFIASFLPARESSATSRQSTMRRRGTCVARGGLDERGIGSLNDHV